MNYHFSFSSICVNLFFFRCVQSFALASNAKHSTRQNISQQPTGSAINTQTVFCVVAFFFLVVPSPKCHHIPHMDERQFKYTHISRLWTGFGHVTWRECITCLLKMKKTISFHSHLPILLCGNYLRVFLGHIFIRRQWQNDVCELFSGACIMVVWKWTNERNDDLMMAILHYIRKLHIFINQK